MSFFPTDPLARRVVARFIAGGWDDPPDEPDDPDPHWDSNQVEHEADAAIKKLLGRLLPPLAHEAFREPVAIKLLGVDTREGDTGSPKIDSGRKQGYHWYSAEWEDIEYTIEVDLELKFSTGAIKELARHEQGKPLAKVLEAAVRDAVEGHFDDLCYKVEKALEGHRFDNEVTLSNFYCDNKKTGVRVGRDTATVKLFWTATGSASESQDNFG